MEAAFQQGFASALLEVLFSRVTDLIICEFKKFKNIDQAVDKLETTILAARNLLLEVDKSQFPSNVVHVWKKRVDKLTTLCYDAEDMIDELVLMIEKHNSVSSKKIEQVRLWRFPESWTKPHGINKLQEKIDAILKELQVLASAKPNGYCSRNLEVPFKGMDDNVKQEALVGRDNDVKSIIEELISGSSNGVSIVGMGGLGKTALARAVMNDERISGTFNKLWISVTGDCFDKEETKKQLSDMLNSGAAGTSSNSKKNLIIFDNLLAVTHEGGHYIVSHAKYMGKTKFLITTRDIRISDLTDTTPYELRTLSQECCKALIMEIARLHNQKLSGQPFSHVACILSSKCEGLPLIARFMGLILAKWGVDQWNTLCNEEDIWKLSVFETEIFPVLKTSYEGMQSDLRSCFAFFSLFPPNCRFYADELVQLWVGAGIIQQPKGIKPNLGGMNHDHLNDLLRRSIFQNCDKERQIFELHKISQKFALLTASKTCLRLDESIPCSSFLHDGTRHLSFFRENMQQPPLWSKIKDLRCLCTILSLHTRNKTGRVERILPNLFKTLGRLRVLALGNTDIAELPDSIKNLKLLRYLDVSSTLIHKLPESISELFGLQILKFSKTPNLSRLPKYLHNMIKLVYLDWDSSSIEHLGLPCNIGNLSSLQSLPLFPVGEKEGHFVTELQNMKNLQNSIIINNLENIKNKEEAEAAMLHEKSLSRIVLQWNKSKNDSIAKDILEGLLPPKSLKELKITRYGGDVFPKWISTLIFLEKIHLQKCHSCTFLPALGPLPSLKILVLDDMESLSYIDTSLHAASTCGSVELFPSLKILKLNDMPVLEEWRGLEANVMQNLCELQLIDCPAMNHFPPLENLTSLSELLVENCKSLESLPELPFSLKSLAIRDSPKLKVECQDGGKEWQKIKAIPDVEVDYKNIKKVQTFDISVSSSSTSSV